MTTAIADTPLSEFAYRSLRQRIFAGTATESSLREADLVRELGISRTPIREALRRLQAEGLLRPIPRGGYTVVEWDPADLQRVYEVRIALERLSASNAASRRTRVDLATMADTIDEIRAATDDGAETLPRQNMRFHLDIAKASGNDYLHGTLVNIGEIFHRYPAAERTLAARHAALAEHEALLAALTQGDGELAEQLMRQHLERGLAVLLNAPAPGTRARTAHRTSAR